MDNVQFEVQSILLRIRDYKKTNQLGLGSFGQIFTQGTLNGLLKYEDPDEQVSIALINFYSKITYLEGKQVLEIMVDAVQKITSVNQLLLEKKLKFIRNAFEHPELDVPIMNSLIKMNRQIESSVPNLLIRELARDSLSQGLKRMSQTCNEELLIAALLDLRNEVLQQIANRNNETVKLIEYPYSIMIFILQLRKPSQFIVQYYIPMLLQLVKFDHPVIWNYLNQAMLFILNLNMQDKLGDDLFETRTLFGQVVLKGISNHLNRLSNMTITEMAQQCEIDTHFFVKFLMDLFSNKDKIKFIFKKCDMNPFQKPVFQEVVQKIFELSRISKRLQCDDGRALQKQIYELQVQLFKISLTKKSQQQTNKLIQFVSDFTNEPRSSIKGMPHEQVVNFLKYCNLFNEKLMIEILGCHKEECVTIMEKYVNTFDYSQLSLVEALRYLTSNFLLFGESQMIERVLNSFTIRYFEQNKDNTYFQHPDYLYTYTYAILLLNTDLFNKTVTKHMSLDDFKKTCLKINNGESLPSDVLVADYNNIQQDEIKCIRDYAITEDLSQFVWDKYLLTKQETRQIYKTMNEYFEIQTDEEHYGDLILTAMVHNIEELIAQTQDVQELTSFLQQVIDICINNDKLDNAQQILISVMKMSNDQYDMSLYAGFYIAEQLLPYTQQFQSIIQLINNSIMQRHKLATDNISKDCRNVLRRIKLNNKFTKKKMGSNEGVLQLFTQFLKQTTDEESEDDLLNELPKQEDQQQTSIGIKSPYLLTNLINQTKFLDKERLNEFLALLLDSIQSISDFKKEYIKFAQIIFISVEILRVNTDRLLQFWPTVVNILTQKQKFESIKKISIKQLLSSYCGYTLLKLVIEFLHQGQSLENYYDCFKQGLEYLIDQSLEILQEFLIEIQKFLKQNSELDFSINFLNNIVQLLLTIFTELEKKTLDSTDAQIIMNLIQDIFEQIQRYQSEKELVQILRKHLEILNTLLKQRQLRSVSSVDGFIAKHTLQIMTTYEKYIHEQDNAFLNDLLSLALNLSNEHLQKIIQIMMQVILNYNYINLKEKEFSTLFNQVTSRQQQILQTNNDQMLVNYSQYLQKMYFNWIQKDRFSLQLWQDILKKFGEILTNLKQNKSPLQENVSLSFQCVCQNQYFQDILKSQNNDVQEKTKQFGKLHNLELLT
ncbi:unnamed protein product [Paramecium sonneborni]|uniref:SEC7 domain-containing protein n=1 Tax=Paramecium sonneborni TaxID=65129 RepID=A0A8S1N0G9_9CILI|nr:unnamed protein product [Paramecium sonneborni]